MRRASTQTRGGRRRWAALSVVIGLAGSLVLTGSIGRAQVVSGVAGGATPPSGEVKPGSPPVTMTFDDVMGGDAGGDVAHTACVKGLCSIYALTVTLPEADEKFYQDFQATLTFRCDWNSDASAQADDVDCLLFSPDGGNSGPGDPDTSDTGPNHEVLTVNNPASGAWKLVVEGAATPVPTAVTGKAMLTASPVAVPPVQTPLAGDPHFANFDFPVVADANGYSQKRDLLQRADAGEPSLGVDWATGKVMYMAGNQVTQISYNDAHPPVPTAKDVTPAISLVNEDAILYTDRELHRTWALGLLLAGSYLSWTDDDGANWTHGLAFDPPALPDHETLGSGPYAAPPPSHAYAHAVYYCAQTIVQDAYCGRSDDGGQTWNLPATPLWQKGDPRHLWCSPLHGHVRVGASGWVYVPNGSCTDADGNGRSGVAVSADNGVTFKVSMPPDSSPGSSDPSVMEGPDGVVYFGYQASSGHPMIATATHGPDGTLKWNPSVDVGRFQDPGETEDGLLHGIQNTEFAEVVTGDPGRAAFAFLGTGIQGAYQDGSFPGTWYLFISYTFDGGKHWRTVNATPHDPVQRGCVWNGGLVNACRNMLDFNDISIDKQGRVYVAYTDGCTKTADYDCDGTPGIKGWNDITDGDPIGGCQPSEFQPPMTSTSSCTFARVSAVVRQTCGRGLIAAYDPGFNESPNCGATTAQSNPTPVPQPTPTPSSAPTGGVHALPNTAAAAEPWRIPVGVGLLASAMALRIVRRRRNHL